MDTKCFDPSVIDQLIENQDLLLGCAFNGQIDNTNSIAYLNETLNTPSNQCEPISLENEQKNIADQMQEVGDFSLLDLLENQDPEMASLFKTINSEFTNEQSHISSNSTAKSLEHAEIPFNSNGVKITNENEKEKKIDFISNNIKKESEEMFKPTTRSTSQGKLLGNSLGSPKRSSKNNKKKIEKRKCLGSIGEDEYDEYDEKYRSFSLSNNDDTTDSKACSSDQSCDLSETSFDSMNNSRLRRKGKNQHKESNKEAATKYRLKKINERNQLFETSQYLERQNEHVKKQIEIVQTEINFLKTFLVQMIIGKNVNS